MSGTAIQIENLRKQYRLGAIGGRTLNAELTSWWARKRGKDDPNLRLGQGYGSYGESFWALDGINLEIKKGEAVGIIGSNGAGKSTLLKILSRVTAPTEGDVWIDGRIAAMLEVGTGFHGELTGRENIYMNGAILGMTKKEVDAKMESIIDFSECRQFIDTPVKRYSSGMYVKLAFAVASHLDAEIMIMDEVLAVGDMKFQKKCLGKMGEEAHGGKTVLYVSHNMATIRNLCSRCIVLDKGKVVFDGDVEKAIGVYIHGKDEKDSIGEKIAKLPADKSFKLLSVRLKQDGRDITSGNVRNSRPLDIEMSYETKKKESGFRVFFDLYDDEGNRLFRSFNDGQQSGISDVSPGLYVSKVSIPENLLAGGDYKLVLNATIYNERNCTGDGLAIPLYVIHDSLYNKAYPGEPCRSKLAVIFDWSTTKCS